MGTGWEESVRQQKEGMDNKLEGTVEAGKARLVH